MGCTAAPQEVTPSPAREGWGEGRQTAALPLHALSLTLSRKRERGHLWREPLQLRKREARLVPLPTAR